MNFFDNEFLMTLIEKAAMPIVVVIIVGIVVNYVLPNLFKLSLRDKENKIRKEMLEKQRAQRLEREAAQAKKTGFDDDNE